MFKYTLVKERKMLLKRENETMRGRKNKTEK